MRATWLPAALALGATLASGCAAFQRDESPREIRVEVYRRAESERAQRLAQEVDRLRDDLRQAEEALVAAESGLRGEHSRADAVSSLAEARIRVERSARRAPWRSEQIDEARAKLGEADRQVQQDHFGAALFFVYRARRISDELDTESRQVHETPGARFVRADQVNLRVGPSTRDRVLAVLEQGEPVFPEDGEKGWLLVRTASGPVGWLHSSLLEGR